MLKNYYILKSDTKQDARVVDSKDWLMRITLFYCLDHPKAEVFGSPTGRSIWIIQMQNIKTENKKD